MDHFGMSVGSLQELEAMLEHSKKFKEQHGRRVAAAVLRAMMQHDKIP
jgi:hypothetical protein